MAIRIPGGAELSTASTQIASGAERVTISLRVRFDKEGPPPEGWGHPRIVRGPGFEFMIMDAFPGASSYPAEFTLKLASGHQRFPVSFFTQASNLLTLVYDAADPQRRFVEVNGTRTPPRSPGLDGPTVSDSAPLVIGQSSRPNCVYVLEDLLIAVGVAADDADLVGLRDADPAAVASIVSRADSHVFYPFGGEPGNPDLSPASGEPLDFSQQRSILAEYADTIAGLEAVFFGEPTVMSSGRAIEVPALLSVNGGEETRAYNVNDNDLDPGNPPTFRINGGPPLSPKITVGANGSHEGLFFVLPDGHRVSPSDSVTWDAPRGLLRTSFGGSLPVVDGPVRNRVNQTTYDLPEDSEAYRVGINLTRPGPRYYSSYQLNTNRAVDGKKISVEAHQVRPDGTFAEGVGSLFVLETRISGIPSTRDDGRPFPLGLWRVSWRDLGAGIPGERACQWRLRIHGDAVELNLLEEYSSDEQQPDGSVNRVRVYEARRNIKQVSLSGSIDAEQTSIPISDMPLPRYPDPSSGRLVKLVLDGEVIVARDVDRSASPPVLLDCVRGAEGTAKSHPANAPGDLMSVSVGGYLYADPRASGSSGPIRYADLAIIQPEDWTPPASPEPVPWEAVDPLEFSQGFLRWSAEGLGVIRAWDSSGNMLGICSRDDIRDPTDVDWGSDKSERLYNIVSVRDLPPDSWCYFHYPIETAQTYEVLLGESLPAEPAGTRRTITVSGGENAPLMWGIRLLAGSERMRVISGEGSTWLVERGVDGTTPESHAAGAIQAGWRVPMDGSGDQALAEFVTDSPHEMASLRGHSSSPEEDANSLSRRTLSLADGVNAKTLTLPVVVDKPDDWEYIVKGLSIRLGGELMRLAGSDPVAGTVTVEKRPGNSTTHSAGSPISAFSNRVFCATEDGSDRRWVALVDRARPIRVTGPNTYAVSRGLPEGLRVVGEQVFDPPAPTESNTVTGVYPLEMLVKCADHANSWYWLNLPQTADDDCVMEIARRVRDNLSPGRKVIVELTNEVWNFDPSFPFFEAYRAAAELTGRDSYIDVWVLESKRRCDLVRSVFAEKGRDDEVLLCLPWQTGSAGAALESARRVGVGDAVDVVGGAPYQRPLDLDAHVEVLAQEDDDVAADLWAFRFARDMGGSTVGRRMRRDREAVVTHGELTNREPITLHYEGGLSVSLPHNEGSGELNVRVDQSIARAQDIRNHPNWYFAERDYLSILQEQTKGQGIAIFNCAQDIWGTSGDKPYGALWGAASHLGQKPGYGDGRDGGVDNRQNIVRFGHPNSAPLSEVSQGSKESVRWRALIDVNRDFFARMENGGGEPGGNGNEDGGEPTEEPRMGRALKLPMRSQHGFSSRARTRSGPSHRVAPCIRAR